MHARASAAYVKWKTHRSDLDAHENERTKRRQKRRRGLSDLSGGGGGTVFVIVIVGRSKGVSLSRLGWSVGPLPSQVTSQAVQREARPTTEATMASSGQHSILHPSIHPSIRLSSSWSSAHLSTRAEKRKYWTFTIRNCAVLGDHGWRAGDWPSLRRPISFPRPLPPTLSPPPPLLPPALRHSSPFYPTFFVGPSTLRAPGAIELTPRSWPISVAKAKRGE